MRHGFSSVAAAAATFAAFDPSLTRGQSTHEADRLVATHTL